MYVLVCSMYNVHCTMYLYVFYIVYYRDVYQLPTWYISIVVRVYVCECVSVHGFVDT